MFLRIQLNVNILIVAVQKGIYHKIASGPITCCRVLQLIKNNFIDKWAKYTIHTVQTFYSCTKSIKRTFQSWLMSVLKQIQFIKQ